MHCLGQRGREKIGHIHLTLVNAGMTDSFMCGNSKVTPGFISIEVLKANYILRTLRIC